jgi:threonine synthase
VGHPSNFERLSWLYGGDRDAMRRDVAGSRHSDDDVQATIKRVYEEWGYLLDPHSAIGYLGLRGRDGQDGQDGQEGRDGREGRDGTYVGRRFSGAGGRIGILLATAHPAKFSEIVDPIIGHAVEKPAPLAFALSQPRHIIRVDASLDAVKGVLGA